MDEARRIMTETRSEWEAIATGLLEYETLSGAEIAELLKGNKPSRPDFDDHDAGPASAVPVIGKRRKPKGDKALGDPEPNPA